MRYLELSGMGNEPHVAVVGLGEALHLGEQLADELRLRQVARAQVAQLIVRINDQASDAVAQNGRLRQL
eukprot:scaffold546_cov352-Prasinococcus_capsulatus_cf.AAC.19